MASRYPMCCRAGIIVAGFTVASKAGGLNNRRDEVLFVTLGDSVDAFMNHRLVALTLGAGIGVVMLFVSRFSAKAMTPDSPNAGLAVMAISLVLRLLAVAASLLAYRHFFPEAFVVFAIGLASGFMFMFTVELLKYGGVFAKARRWRKE
ncbi:MAG: hypothetical protein KGZ89_03380 [Actinobacteria bacterium]|nr:hypothetical protein [Actinomycetota bacterium]